jgi:hypothetical protein
VDRSRLDILRCGALSLERFKRERATAGGLTRQTTLDFAD